MALQLVRLLLLLEHLRGPFLLHLLRLYNFSFLWLIIATVRLNLIHVYVITLRLRATCGWRKVDLHIHLILRRLVSLIELF